MKYRLAKCLASCYYGQEYRPEEEDYRIIPKEEETKVTTIESAGRSEELNEESASTSAAPSPAASPAIPAANVATNANESGNVTKVKEMFNNLTKPTSAPPSPAVSTTGTSPTLPRASSKKGFGSTISPSPAVTAGTSGREAGKRQVNQFLGIKRKQTPSLPRRKEKVKFSHEQMEAMAHYRSLSNLAIAQYYDSVLSYFRVCKLFFVLLSYQFLVGYPIHSSSSSTGKLLESWRG
jgi:hypothetical protein